MRSLRSASLAVWAVVAVSFAGCASTSIPARVVRLSTGQVQPDQAVSVDRLVAIGRTFERQGNFERAQGMYHLVLSHEPTHGQAATGLQRIAALRSNNNRVFDGGQPAAQQAEPTMMAQAPPRPRAATQQKVVTVAAAAPAARAAATLNTPIAEQEVTPQPEPAVTTAVAEPREEEWQLPRIAESVSSGYHAQRVGRVRMENTLEAAENSCETYQAPVETGSACPANSSLEACLQSPADHIDQLLASFSDSDDNTRSLAAFLLGEAGSAATWCVSSMHEQLRTDPSAVVRMTLAEAIGKIERSDVQARQLLLDGLNSPSAESRAQCAFALRVFAGSGDRVTIQCLTAALSDTDERVASMAALSLSDFGNDARPALPALQATRSIAPHQLREAVDAAIIRISLQ